MMKLPIIIYSSLSYGLVGYVMGKIFKSKKVIAAFVTLLVAVLGTALGTDLGADTANTITELVCTIVSCQ